MTTDECDAFVLRAAYEWLNAEPPRPSYDVVVPVARTRGDVIAFRIVRQSLERLASRGFVRISPGRSNATYAITEVTEAGRAHLERSAR